MTAGGAGGRGWSWQAVAAKVDALVYQLNQLQEEAKQAMGQPPAQLQAGGWLLDGSRLELHGSGRTLALTVSEVRLLAELMRQPGKVVARRKLLRLLCEGAGTEGQLRNVDRHVARLRAKLGLGGDQIETIRGVGYCFNTEAAWQ